MSDLDPEEFRRLGYAVVDWIAGYRAGVGDLPVRPAVEPGWVRAQLPDALPEAPRELGALLGELDRVVVPATTHWQHPGFFGYFPANASLHSVLGDLLSGGLGVQGMLWSTSPAATEVEQVLLDGLADALGLDPAFTWAGGGGGTIADSASSAALVALLAALHRTSGGAWRESGVDGTERVYVTAETHSSLAKAVRVAGLGARALRVVPPSRGSLAMSADALAEMLAADVAAGLRPVLVCATVGTTGTGAVDPVAAITAVTAPHGVWVHVDAAWAGVAALCPEHRDLLDGTRHVDSFCTDAHKWLLTAFDASLLWVRDAAALPAALSITPEYLRNSATDSGAVVDYRDWQVPLGRRFRALKLWAVIHGFGLEGLRAHLRGHVALAAELESWIVAEPGFVLAVPRSLSLVCFRLQAGDDATRALSERVNATGSALLTHTVVDGRYVVRVAIGSVATEREHVVALWDQLRGEALRG
ncbi:pyridoxal-dependent decarboxylase [Pseudonocardia abyssalis]|uniref:Aspartate aminotransferase family protein n=1 Tax=Pseudonocardia abyssalis TaxID=2792008 RepID=A0ABS6UQI1_9PSEU|nr:pyridoxal-dependent decarboxylase [Pseudonocardia abyssalis]MBW0117598.1 aspartate aminotransferase family protein [Pseudonocardia abyssalis]MBW0134521.1 aspartate aminotransferase family protein [Pseudonocardia abyssalis]